MPLAQPVETKPGSSLPQPAPASFLGAWTISHNSGFHKSSDPEILLQGINPSHVLSNVENNIFLSYPLWNVYDSKTL